MELADWHMWWKRSGARELRALLMEHWDPLGVAGEPEAADEYDEQVGKLGQMLREGTTADDIGTYLGRVRAESMELSPWPEMDLREREIGPLVTTWYRQAMQRS